MRAWRELRAALETLVEGLPAADDAADVRLWVDRAFTIRGAGTVVTGTLGAGRIKVDDELELATAVGRRRVTVRGLQSLGADVSRVRGVSRVAVNLRGVPRDADRRAATRCSSRTPGSPSRPWTAASSGSRWAPESGWMPTRCPRS